MKTILTILLSISSMFCFSQTRLFPERNEVKVSFKKEIFYPLRTNLYRIILYNKRSYSVSLPTFYSDGGPEGVNSNLFFEIEKIEPNGSRSSIAKSVPDYFYSETNIIDSNYISLKSKRSFKIEINPFELYPQLEKGKYRIRVHIKQYPVSMNSSYVIEFIDTEWIYFSIK